MLLHKNCTGETKLLLLSLLDNFRYFCLRGKFRHLKLDFFNLYLMWFQCRQIVYSSLLISHLYLASDFNPFLLMPDRLFCSWGGAWAAVCANDVTAASWLAHLKENSLFFQHDKDSAIPSSWLDIKAVFFSIPPLIVAAWSQRRVISRL